MNKLPSISADFPSGSKFVTINHTKIHYIDQGKGDPILLLHGIPTSSYLWRNIIPGVSKIGRCIAPDLVGMGKSDKPDIPYRIFDHVKYIEEFIKTLNLKHITLILHGLGAVIGLDYAMRHSANVKAIVFYEVPLAPFMKPDAVSLPVGELLSKLKDSQATRRAIFEDDYFIDKIFNLASLRKLSSEELVAYREPFLNPNHRQPVWQYTQEFLQIPLPKDVKQLINSYTEFLTKTTLPKLMLYSIPGFLTTMAAVEWCRVHFPNLTLTDLHEGLHFAQEYNPELFTTAVTNWYTKQLHS